MDEDPRTATIYMIVINDTFEQYVGKTIKPVEVRIRHHTHTDQFVDRKMRAHGYDWCVIEKCRPEDTWALERYYIDLFKTNVDCGFGGLNLTGGGDWCFTLSDVSKLKKSASLLKHYEDPANRKRQSDIQQEVWSRKGMREKVSKKSLEQWSDPEFVEKMQKINNTLEHKEKISNGCKKAWADPEHYAKMCVKRQKVWDDPKYHEKMSLAHINSKKCNEFRKRVVQLTKEGVFIKEHESMTAAAKAVGLASYTSITHCCNGRFKTSKGYKWMYHEDYIKKYINTKGQSTLDVWFDI